MEERAINHKRVFILIIGSTVLPQISYPVIKVHQISAAALFTSNVKNNFLLVA